MPRTANPNLLVVRYSGGDVIVGRILGHEDDDRVLVLWGDARFGNDPDRARVENLVDLIPFHR